MKARFFIGLWLVFMLCGCKPKATAPSEPDASVADSTEAATPVAELPMLPDTAFASVGDMKITVEVVDTATPPNLQFTHSEYTDSVGVYTFRGNNLRNAHFSGHIKGTPTKIVKDWTFQTAMGEPGMKYGPWYGGTGWTGQPLFVQWPDSLAARMAKAPGVTAEFAGSEVIVGSLCGQIYFLNPATGKETRTPLAAGTAIKGTPSLDPTLNGNLYVGQGVPMADDPFGCEAFNLFTGERFFFRGRDPKARRGWNAFDSSPVAAGGFLFWPGENGTIYKYTRRPGSLSLHSTLVYTLQGRAPGIESSVAVWCNYGYVSDNHGNIVCVNLNTMKPVWHYLNLDDSDSSPVVDVVDGVPYVYAGCEVDKRGDGATARMVKLNGLSGQEEWLAEEQCERWHCSETKVIDGGVFGTPLLGAGDCSESVYFNVCKHGRDRGVIIAFDKQSGKEQFRTQLKSYAWSSMVRFLNERGEMYIFLGDCAGYVYLIRGRDGQIIYTERMGSNFESSPAVVGNSCFLGSRGTDIYKFSIE